MRFGHNGKLLPRFIGPFKILDPIGAMAYRLALTPRLASVYNVFNISILLRMSRYFAYFGLGRSYHQ